MQALVENRCPNFIVGGAIKAGTSSLHQYLKQHPEIFVPDRKELRYFAYDRNNEFCIQHPEAFPIKSAEQYLQEFSTVAGEIAIGEVSPNYLASNIAPSEIHSFFPEMKLIFSLRNPIDSAYSAYQMDVRAGRETRPVELALATNERRVERYRYYNYLKEWYKIFNSEQIFVVSFDNLISNPEATMKEIFAFLGVDSSYTPSIENVATNSGGLPETFISTKVYRATLALRRIDVARRARAYMPQFAYAYYRKMRDSSLKKAPPISNALRSDLCNYYREDVYALKELTKLQVEKWGILES